ncbi:hypothetical protein [Pseudomonas pseudonitroreducens]|uniref:hypothetical protein n=1 Tax=Pseudomonas pseudonitroreducens TaxID=2892326 RepID=UPI001F170194|nr:hypothetical protein [Pseudomonas pseudonitroreducens]
MNLVRFFGSLFVFLGVLASCAVASAVLFLMLRFWPVLLVFVLACCLFGHLLNRQAP